MPVDNDLFVNANDMSLKFNNRDEKKSICKDCSGLFLSQVAAE